MRALVSRLQHAVRALGRHPAYSVVAILTLGLGIGANVAIFAVVDGVLLRPLDYPEGERIVAVLHHAPGLDLPEIPQSDGTSLMYMHEVGAFAAFASMETEGRNLAGDAGTEARRISVLATTAEFFPVFGVTPRMGRALVEADSEVDAPTVTLLGHDLWVGTFGADPAIVGRTITLDGESVEVVGILPPGVRLPDDDFDAVVSMELDPAEGFGSFTHNGVARLAPGASLERAQSEVTALQARLPEFFPDVQPALLEAANWSASVTPIKELVVEEVRTTLWILMGTVGFVLLIAAANVANLVLVRAESRQRETAVRTALGADRRALFGTFLAESVVIAAAAALLGLVVASGALRLLLAVAPEGLPRREQIGVTGSVFLFCLMLSAVSALVFGLLPLARAGARDVSGALKEGLRGSTGSRSSLRARNGLVIVQLALALILVAGSGLMLRSFQALRALDPGLDPEGVTSMRVSLDRSYAEEGASTRLYRALQERVAGLPGVEAVGLVNQVPLEGRGMSGGSFEVDGWTRADDAPPVVASRQRVTPGYLEALAIPLLAGRAPTWADAQDRAQVAWVTETLVRQFIEGDPVGQKIRDGEESPWMVIAGVVGDVPMEGLGEDIRPGILRLNETADSGEPALQMALLVKGPASNRIVPEVRSILRELDPGVPISVTETMDEIVARDLADTSFTAALLGLAAVLSLVLGTVGIYGVISYVVSQRTRELGVRMALGARAADVRSMVVRQGLTVIGVGLVLGLIGAVALTRVLGSLLFAVSATDPLVLGGTALILLAVSLFASFVPALRASRVDPVEALRAE